MFEGLKKSLGNILNKLSQTELKGKPVDSILWNFKLALLENDVALSVTDMICTEVKNQLQGIKVQRFEDKRKIVEKILRSVINNILISEAKIDLLDRVKKKKEGLDAGYWILDTGSWILGNCCGLRVTPAMLVGDPVFKRG